PGVNPTEPGVSVTPGQPSVAPTQPNVAPTQPDGPVAPQPSSRGTGDPSPVDPDTTSPSQVAPEPNSTTDPDPNPVPVTDEPYDKPASPPADEDGTELWLRYPKVSIPGRLSEYQAAFTHVVQSAASPTLQAAQEELV